MPNNIAFTPVKGLEKDIRDLDYREGCIYFAEDSGKLFLDSNNNRIAMGGAGVSVFFAHEDRVSTNIVTDVHTLLLKNIDAKDLQKNDLIINTSNGCFYQVINIVDDKVNCYRVAVSGSGGGGGGTGPSTGDSIYIEGLEILTQRNVFRYNESDIIIIKPVVESNLDIYGTIICEGFILDQNGNSKLVFSQNFNNIPLNQNYDLNLGKILPLYKFNLLTFKLTTLNSGTSPLYKFNNISVLDIGLELDKSSGFKTSEPKKEDNVIIPVVVSGIADNEKLIFYLNDSYVGEKSLSSSDNEKQSYKFNQSMASYHSGLNIIKIDLLLNNIILDSLIIELVWIIPALSNEPIIWLDSSNQTEGDEYKNVEIKYCIYDPIALSQGVETVPVEYYVNDNFLFEDTYTITNTTSFASLITKSYNAGEINTYTIKYKWGTEGNIKEITKSHQIFINLSTRRLDYAEPEYFKIFFSPDNRSNSETLKTRTAWKDPYSFKLYQNSFNEYFNWVYNGWMYDDKFNSILRINNGATFTIPLDKTYYYNDQSEDEILNTTFEFQFKVSNVKSYKSIIQQITQYYVEYNDTHKLEWVDEDQLDESIMTIQKNDAQYEIIRIKKIINATEDDVFCSYGKKEGDSFVGFLLSPEEALFSSGESTVNVKYQKDELITLSFVLGLLDENATAENATRSIKIYLNGVLAGIVTVSQSFLINSRNIIFNSNICDIDLYNFRFYKTALTMGEVIQNYLADIKDAEIYDQNLIFKANNKNILSTNPKINYTNTINYEKLQEYNAQADDEHQSMCYAVITIQENIKENDIKSGRLPVFKGDKKQCTIDFYNPTLDRALASKKITSFTDALPYLPSFQATDVEINVQGTSSQGYPRRNFKIKTEKGHLYFNADESNTDYGANGIYLDDIQNKTNKFTWKVDYMDSSSAHNTGLANLIPEFYEDHPLSRYDTRGNYKTKYRTSVYGFPMMVFQKHTYEDSDNVDYEFIGKYNFNLDKNSNSYFGFEDTTEHPYLTSWQYGSGIPKYKDIAECWEVKNNQGTWTSFKLGENNLDTTDDIHHLLSIIDFFEYRYLPKRTTNESGDTILSYTKKDEIKNASWADYLDWAYNYADPDQSKKTENPDEFNNQQISQINDNLKLMHKNIYDLIEWLNSVDYLASGLSNEETDDNIIEEESFIIEEQFMYPDSVGSDTTKYENYDPSIIYLYPKRNSLKSCYEMIPVIFDPTADGYIEEFEGWTPDNFKTVWIKNVVFAYDEMRNNSFRSYAIEKVFKHDTPEYRKAKFKAEFDKHLDKEYCLVYAVLTELLLMYDSRGKNMMLASWGPTANSEGNYIWFPIFYDLDTQLGLNNSGIPTFDYDIDATNQGAFSTSNSVLWNNLYACFKPEILAIYGKLRDGNLNAKNIEQSYEYTPTKALNLSQNSYVQRGVRPLCIHNADEYYKYLAPISTGYWSTNANANMRKDDGQYLYACQGTRETYRKSLLKNRFNYLDSDWKAGSYAGSSKLDTSIRLRINANGDDTSDERNVNNLVLEANPSFTIEPYLTQYISVLYDKIYSRAKNPGKAGNPQTPDPAPAFAAGFEQDSTNFEQQIVYLPGANATKSFGDLSLKYIDEWNWPTLDEGESINIQDFILGNDEPGYYNRKLTGLTLSSQESPKPLLEKVILTGLGAINVNSLINARYCPKLKEFRALDTLINGVLLNDGTIIQTLHLPSHTTQLELLNAINLTQLCKTLPLRGEQTYQEYQNQLSSSGLYLEELFTSPITSNLKYLSLQNDKLEYQSYEIFSQIIEHYNNTDTTVNLSLINVNWDPYILVERDEELDFSNNNYYMLDIDHTYKLINNNEEGQTLQNNNKLYKQITLNGIAPTSLATLNACKDGNNFIGLKIGTKPNITGRLFIQNNSESPIDAEDIEVLEKYYAGLTITAAFVNKGVTVTYVKENNESHGFDSIRHYNYKKIYDEEKNQYYIEVQKPPVELEPYKGHYTFLYWQIDGETGNFFKNEESRKYYLTNEETDEIILKPIFQIDEYTINFIFDNEERIENNNFFTFRRNAFTTMPTPPKIPYLDSSTLSDDLEKGPRRYRFLGFSKNIDEVKTYLSNDENIPVYYTYLELNEEQVLERVDYYAIFQEEYIFLATEPDNESYFYFSENTSDNTYTIGLNKELQGKILLPSYYQGKAVTKILQGAISGNMLSQYSFNTSNGKNITHIYWYEDKNKGIYCQLKEVNKSAFFENTKLKYFQFNSRFKEHKNINVTIYGQAFSGTNLINDEFYIQILGASCFSTALKNNNLKFYNLNTIEAAAISDWIQNENQNNYYLYLGNKDYPYTGTLARLNNLSDSIKAIKEFYWKPSDKSYEDAQDNLTSYILNNEITFIHKNESDFIIKFVASDNTLHDLIV